MAKKKADKEPKADRRPFKGGIHVKLNQDEIIRFSMESARLVDRLDTTEAKYSAVKKQWNADIKEIRTKITQASKNVVQGTEPRHVEAEEHYDLKAKEIWVVYKGEEYNRRSLSDDEVAQLKQKPLFPKHDKEEAMNAGVVDGPECDDDEPPSAVSDVDPNSVGHSPLEAVQ